MLLFRSMLSIAKTKPKEKGKDGVRHYATYTCPRYNVADIQRG